MKKTLITIGTTLTLLFCGTSLSAQNGGNDNGLIGKAHGAASDCINNYTSQGIAVAANVETTGICFVSGSLHKVTFYTTVKCHNEPCPKPASVLVATVYFDCDNNVSSVECND
jgi:hypothetical protein